MGLFNKIFGSYNDRELKKIYPIADAIEKLEPEYAALTDDALRAKTDEFKARYNDGETLDELLPEAFAAVREAAAAAVPFDILPAVWVSSLCSVTAGLLAGKGLARIWP